MNNPNNDALEVGDVMRWSAALVEDLQTNDEEWDVLVRVRRIERQPDGTVKLWLENANLEPGSGLAN